jgi:hypothetical protein
MAEMIPPDPESANDYDDRTTAAVKSVLVEIGQILGGFQGKYAVIGGPVAWLLLNNEDMPHVGTLDIDLGLDAEALGDGEYALSSRSSRSFSGKNGSIRPKLIDYPPDLCLRSQWKICA